MLRWFLKKIHLPRCMVWIWSHESGFSRPPHHFSDMFSIERTRDLRNTLFSKTTQVQLQRQLTNKYIMFNYPYDIINNTAQPHGNQEGVSFEFICDCKRIFTAMRNFWLLFSIGPIIGEWFLFIIAIRHPCYLKFSVCKGLQSVMKRQKR